MILSYLKVAIRILIKNRRFSIINLVGLSVSLAGFIIILSWLSVELSYDAFHTKKNQIVQIAVQAPEGILDPNTPYAIAGQLSKQYPEISSYSKLIRMESRINCSFIFKPESNDPVLAYEPAVAKVDTGFFSIFDFDVVFGNKAYFFGGPNSVVISSDIANIYYENKDPVGQTIILNKDQILTITGVIDIPVNTLFQFDFFIPNNDDYSGNWNWADPSFLLLKPGVDIKAFNKKITSFLNENYPGTLPIEFPLRLIPIHKTYLEFSGRGKILVFSSVALLLLVVALLNYMNLSTANFTKRKRETGIRKVFGATRKKIIVHFFTETFILAFVALIVALFLAELALPAMGQLFGKHIEIGYFENPLILLVLLLVVILLSILASLYPSILFSRGVPADILQGSSKRSGRRSSIIQVTLIMQFTLSIALLISTLIITKQIKYTTETDLGFSTDNILSIAMNQGIGNNFIEFLDRLETHPDIKMVSAGQSFPYNSDYKTNIDWPNKQEQTMGLFRYSICLNNYAEIFEMEIVAGRGYIDGSSDDLNKFLINKTAAEMLNMGDPIGKSITMWGLSGEIIGVVKDFHHVSLHREILPHIINIHPSNYQNLKYIFIKLNSGRNPETLKFIETACKDYAPDYPVSFTFLEDDVSAMYTSDINLSKILGLFAFMALIVSSLGIYGLAYYSVEKLSAEFAVRKVFGANQANILSMIYINMLKKLGISFILAIIISLLVSNRWLHNFAYQIKPDVLIYIIPAVFASIIASVATLLAIWRLIRESPSTLLKQD